MMAIEKLCIRPSVEVAAEKARKKEEQKQKELEETANLQALAWLNVQADEHRVLRKATAVRRISDIPEEDEDREGCEDEFIPLDDEELSEDEDDVRWTKQLLPTAYYRLYVSDAPFDEFSLSSKGLAGIAQVLIRSVYESDASLYVAERSHFS